MSKSYTIGLIGNPNCGKTTIFNILTGSSQRVGNWSGVTIEKKIGHFKHADEKIELVDLPGTYTLYAVGGAMPLDEQVSQSFVFSKQADLFLNIVDGSSLERSLYLTTQLMASGTPVVIALNMMDIADQRGMHIDPLQLSQALGCPVIPIIASKGEGLGPLKDVIHNTLLGKYEQQSNFHYNDQIIDLLIETANVINDEVKDRQLNIALSAVACLEGDALFLDSLKPETLKQLQTTEAFSDELVMQRYQWIETVVKKTCSRDDHSKSRSFADIVDSIVLNRIAAFPIFLIIMYLLFMITINIGSAFIDVFDITAGALFVELPTHLMQNIGIPDLLITIIATGFGGGIQLVASFIPVIFCLFLCLSILEDTGYMARAAFIIDRLLCQLGLPGRSFVPLLVGFGCNVPAVMAARTLENQNDRLLVTMMAPFMSCGARLTVYALFAAAFFPRSGQNVVFGLYLIGFMAAIFTALVLKKMLQASGTSPFVMELPAYHRPTIRNVFTQSWHRLKGFIVRAGKAIIIVVVILNVVNSIGIDGSIGNENTEKSILSHIGMKIAPVLSPIGVKDENWPAAVGLFTGIFAKELIVGTLDTLYESMLHNTNGIDNEAFDLRATLKDGLATVPTNLSNAISNWQDPLGINIGSVENSTEAAKNQGVAVDTFSTMQRLFDGWYGAFAYLLIILLYTPCVATLGAIRQEAGSIWAVYSAWWGLVLAIAVSLSFYQTATFAAHPSSAMAWIIGSWTIVLFTAIGFTPIARKSISAPIELIPVKQL